MYFVYTLADPRTDGVAYVGITNNAYIRFFQHINSRDTNGKKSAWIQALQDQKLIPRMAIIEILESKEAALDREKHWIHFYIEQGVDLVNLRIDPIEPKKAREKVTLELEVSVDPPPCIPEPRRVIRRDEANLRVCLRHWREHQGKSVDELAEEAHISPITIHKIEEDNFMPRPSVLERLIQVLGIKMEDLIIDISEDKPAA